jgi:hypothetical protein
MVRDAGVLRSRPGAAQEAAGRPGPVPRRGLCAGAPQNGKHAGKVYCRAEGDHR